MEGSQRPSPPTSAPRSTSDITMHRSSANRGKTCQALKRTCMAPRMNRYKTPILQKNKSSHPLNRPSLADHPSQEAAQDQTASAGTLTEAASAGSPVKTWRRALVVGALVQTRCSSNGPTSSTAMPPWPSAVHSNHLTSSTLIKSTSSRRVRLSTSSQVKTRMRSRPSMLDQTAAPFYRATLLTQTSTPCSGHCRMGSLPLTQTTWMTTKVDV